MANSSPSFESARELAIIDKQKVKRKYCPPPVCEMKYWILDKKGHCKFFFMKEDKFKKCLKKLMRQKDANDRYCTCLD